MADELNAAIEELKAKLVHLKAEQVELEGKSFKIEESRERLSRQHNAATESCIEELTKFRQRRVCCSRVCRDVVAHNYITG